MILLELKKYIKQHDRVSLKDIQNHFDVDEEAAIGLMQPLLQQGYIQEIVPTDTCGSGRCSTGCHQVPKTALFQWLETPVKALSIPVEIV